MSGNSADVSPTMEGPQTASGPQIGSQTAPGPQTGPLPYLVTPQVYNPTPHYNVTPMSPSKRDNYAAKQSIGLGATQITIGIICIILQIVSICIQSSLRFVGQGIWAGIFFIVSGAFGITAGKKKSPCMIISHMVLSIVSAVIALFSLSPSAIGVAEDVASHYGYYGDYPVDYMDYDGPCNWANNTYTCCDWRNGTYTCWEEPNPPIYDIRPPSYTDYSERDPQIAVNSLLLIFCFIEIVIAIWASVISCVGVCCGPPLRQSAVGAIQVQYVTGPGQGTSPQVIIITPNGQALASGQFAPQHPHPQFIVQQVPVYPGVGGIQPTVGGYWTNPPSYSPGDKGPSDLSSPEYRYAPQGNE